MERDERTSSIGPAGVMSMASELARVKSKGSLGISSTSNVANQRCGTARVARRGIFLSMMGAIVAFRTLESSKNGSPWMFLNLDGARLHWPRFWFGAAVEDSSLKGFYVALHSSYVCEQVGHGRS